MASDSDSTSGSSSDADSDWTCNEGESTDNDEETPADQSLRGEAALVTASCPRRCPRCLADRRKQRLMIPEDFTTAEFLKKFRRTFNAHNTVKLEEAICADEPHKRFSKTRDRRERHKHVAIKASATFAHNKIADAFHREHGLRISLSFKQKRFVGNVAYLLEPGKKASVDIDAKPATFPANLDVKKELGAHRHPTDPEAKEGKKRKRLTFDELSHVVLEGVGQGPLKTAKDVQKAAKQMKLDGKVELWNYIGDLKSAADLSALVSKVWRMWGVVGHRFFRTAAKHTLETYSFGQLRKVKAWLDGGYKTEALILSGDGGLGKTSLAEALLMQVCPEGFWFIDDPDDLRELEGEIESRHGILVDEITLEDYKVNQVKKLLDVERARRIKCRHFNGTIPEGCPRIFCTNSSIEDFYPHFPSKYDRVGVMRRQSFVAVSKDLRKRPAKKAVAKNAFDAEDDSACFEEEEED